MNADQLRKLWMEEGGFSNSDIETSMRDDPPFSVEREAKQLQLIRRSNISLGRDDPGEIGIMGEVGR